MFKMSVIKRIRKKIVDRNYYLSSHAEEEMLDDRLDRKDIENSILHGEVRKKLTDDIRGVRYKVQGPARDGRMVEVICRFREDSNLVIVTSYVVEVDYEL